MKDITKIKRMLKQVFPDYPVRNWSVQSDKCSSDCISWIDGPLKSDVDQFLKTYSFKSFSTLRILSEERKVLIEDRLDERFEADLYGDYLLMDWEIAEKELIRDGKLQGYPMALNVIPFPEKKLYRELTPEQRLKLIVIRQIIKDDFFLGDGIDGDFIDEQFKRVAEKICSFNEPPYT
ncbi:hypothetical protein ERICIV_04617 (plasmid) [Paenibacillus larvae subsp. larvae]|uniref:Uncharacterized protein n=1 Tax=Paenibacillus larvae subsp. larvae TaxID=147375 RepID=A0A2L1U7T3_9BACL|nr:hypothetical protein [Paenibacillus larvae]AQT87037.1 hypothetical protein B1222_23695 [Paenibacillus larvae subsp. pulvifaciens]AQZ49355.1 hypothetical protein B5S25_22900 [Paenibacillus larvae subsp. pulvifaciens]AVF28999.1 hypothetical protein ERICIII_04998 [Paenibacillus larvae subsp. larvae]AVF33380.1 hypothetical protein ERICIV_04617 [Paenibacillus larvae subsp. larvae]MBH0341152.1 hypothetical protein [Paenibacillus larvae]